MPRSNPTSWVVPSMRLSSCASFNSQFTSRTWTLGSGSFLQKANNVAGVDATPAPGQPRHWNVATSQLERVLYGAILYPQVVESMNQAALMLRDLSTGIPKALEQKGKSPQAPLAQAATWERLATMFQRQGSAAGAANARRLEAALRN